MNITAIIFGGSGYIGTHLLKVLLEQSIFEKYIVADIKPLKGFIEYLDSGLLRYERIDVRKTIELRELKIDSQKSWIFNFAAVHREPGHAFKEYFDTNIPGAKNINSFATKNGISNILFTSSIAPYGRSREQRNEQSELYPETAYGISKGMCELIHKNWQQQDPNRRLIVVRPSVIFGPKDPGNVYRMIGALKKGTFVLPNGGKVIKAYGYVYGLVESMIFAINRNEKFIVYNYAENPVVPLNEMVAIAKKELAIKKPTLSLPVNFLAFVAGVLQFGFRLIDKKSDIHPVRVRKAAFPTNIKPEFLIEKGFDFKYDFKNALRHWKTISPEDF